MKLGADERADGERLLPVRMVNELAYCPRLFYLEWVEGEFEDNAFTVEGRLAHRRVDNVRPGPLPQPEDDASFIKRSVSLSSESLGISAKIDLVEGEGGLVSPVDYKRGRPPENAEQAHEPERVQLCAYGLLLREHGYRCESGILYFAESRQRIEVPFDEALVNRTRELISLGRALAAERLPPPPLEGSPKCQGCSLHAICLPDEVTHLRADAQPAESIRHFAPARDDAAPVYVQEQGARVGVSGEVLEVVDREREKLAEARLFEVSQLVLMGNVQVSSQAIRSLFERQIPVVWLSFGGWLAGMAEGHAHGNIDLRRAQFRRADDPAFCLETAKRLVRNKIQNCRTFLRRNAGDLPALRTLADCAEDSATASSLETLLGVEGNAARAYFSSFSELLKLKEGTFAFDFQSRTRRPPKDPVNALLSFAYSMLAKEVVLAVRVAGLDPFLGVYHQPRFGRPALALDLMEEFRPLIADSVVVAAINTGVVRGTDFVRSGVGVALTSEGRKRFVAAFERRLSEEVTHPVFGYRISYRRVLEVQARLFARYLNGELTSFPEFRTR